MQLLDNLRFFLLVVEVEPLLKGVRGGKYLRQQEVEQRPQLMKVVLQWRAGDEQPVVGFELAHHFGEDGVLVLDPVGLVDDDVAVVERPKVPLLLHHHLVAGDAHVELAGLQKLRLLLSLC